MKWQRLIDTHIGTVLALVLAPIRIFSHKPRGKRLVFVKLWAIGESILTLPALKCLHDKGWNITVVCRKRNREVFQQPYLTVVPFNLRLLRHVRAFDVAIDGEPYMKLSALLSRLLAPWTIGFGHGVRAVLYDEKVRYNDQQHVVKTYGNLIKPLGVACSPTRLQPLSRKRVKKQKVVALSPGVAESGKSRMWSSSKWAALADKLIEEKIGVCFVGSSNDIELVNHIIKCMQYKPKNLTGKTSLSVFFNTVKTFSVLVACDTGTMHIAAAQGVPTVGLFGPNTPLRFGPLGKRTIAIYKPIKKKPCINVHLGRIDCSHKNHMTNITVNDVLSAVRRLV